MTAPSGDRTPAAFGLDDPRLRIDTPAEESFLAEPEQPTQPMPAKKSWAWGSMFLSAVGGLLLLGLLLWIQQTILSLLARSDWLGWAATVLFAIAVLAFAMIVLRELTGLLRLSAIASTRADAIAALAAENTKAARAAALEVQAIFADRRELGEGLLKLRQSRGEIHDARQILTLTERELLLPLDRAARTIIGTSGRRVSVVTSLSPAALVAVGFVAFENFRMLRSLATTYGGRPGFFAILKLMRLIAGHLAVTGGIAFTDDIVQQFIGHGLTARLSQRLGEGLVNGGFTIRIGIAAVEVLRPLPYIEARQPRVREFVSEFLKMGQTFSNQKEETRA
jgi:putative membrane protein